MFGGSHMLVVRLRGGGVAAHLLELTDVGARREALRARAADDDHLDLGIGVQRGELVGNTPIHAKRDRVVALRLVEDDGGDGAFALDADFVGHCCRSCSSGWASYSVPSAEQTFELVAVHAQLRQHGHGVLTEPGRG